MRIPLSQIKTCAVANRPYFGSFGSFVDPKGTKPGLTDWTSTHGLTHRPATRAKRAWI